MDWTVISSMTDWKAFMSTVARKYGMTVKDVELGVSGPSEYPALVQVRLDLGKPRFNYVYVDHAQKLLDALPANRPTAKVSSGKANPSLDKFNEHVFAMGMALSYFVIETGIAKKKQFEEKLQEFKDLFREEKEKGNKYLLEGSKCPWSQE